MSLAFEPLAFACGKSIPNRFVLAPLTSTQGEESGAVSKAEQRFLQMRAQGGYGLVMTCAAHVSPHGQAFPRQLAIYSDDFKSGLSELAKTIQAENKLAIVQLHHGGMRALPELIGEQARCPSDNERAQARAMTSDEVQAIIKDFIQAAVRAQQCGFDGVELHGAHGYLIGQFLSSTINQRTDNYGGSFENRSRLLWEIIRGIRQHCGQDFFLGVRLSPERFGMKLDEILSLSQEIMTSGLVDFLDISAWDLYKYPVDEHYQAKTLVEYFIELERGNCKLGFAGKVIQGKDVEYLLELGADCVVQGETAIVEHDFPQQLQTNPNHQRIATPVSAAHLREQGLSQYFIDYLATSFSDIVDTSA